MVADESRTAPGRDAGAREDVVIAAGSIPGRLEPGPLFGWGACPRPLELEIGCGKGTFLVAAATRWRGHDFLAVEHSRRLVRKVRDKVLRGRLTNVRLYHGNARDLVGRLLPEACLARVHVYFPDPWPKRRHAKHRLFAEPFPDQLARVMAPGAALLFATDHDPYFREVVARLAVLPAFVRTTAEEPFRDLPLAGFHDIFAAQAIPTYRACWLRTPPQLPPAD
jgi:tRNA (guanine-N7-)-methyltransferase